MKGVEMHNDQVSIEGNKNRAIQNEDSRKNNWKRNENIFYDKQNCLIGVVWGDIKYFEIAFVVRVSKLSDTGLLFKSFETQM